MINDSYAIKYAESAKVEIPSDVKVNVPTFELPLDPKILDNLKRY
jgi:hypothetical protein